MGDFQAVEAQILCMGDKLRIQHLSGFGGILTRQECFVNWNKEIKTKPGLRVEVALFRDETSDRTPDFAGGEVFCCWMVSWISENPEFSD